MTDAEKLEEWYRKNGILKGIEFHVANIYDDYYIQELEEPMFLGRPPIYKVEEDDFIFVQGDEYEHVLWVYEGSPEQIKPEDVPDFLKQSQNAFKSSIAAFKCKLKKMKS